MTGLQTRFEQAAREVQLLPERPSNDTLLRLYALYKQGAEGDANGPTPGFFDFVGTAKHEAWAKLAGTPRNEAMQQYVDLVDKLRNNTRMARQTRQRILDTSLAMFNAQGEPNVTTNHIADELEISPGNLYYHFRNKDDIIEHLFGVYEQRMDTALAAPSGRLPELEDVWLQLHLVFECIWDHRFLYRDLVNILSRNRRLRMRFARILRRADTQAHKVMRGLAQAGIMRASAAEVDAAATNVLVIATFWLNYAAARGDKDERASIRDGIVQVMMLIAPFLRDAERVHLNTLTRAYLD